MDEAENERQAAYTLVGEALSLWNQIEGSLAFLFASYLKTDASIAMASYHAVISFEARLAMVNAAAEKKLRLHPELFDRWKTLSGRISKKAKKRAEIAHCTIMIMEHNGRYTVEALPYWHFSKLLAGAKYRGPGLMPVAPNGLSLSLKQLDDRIASFKDLNARIIDLNGDVERASQPPEEAP
ncbi:hypothetical protein ACFPB0_03800 [Glycocaulis abyssi]|uniref:Uncharacterized protein n=1 Tax=Glycocaulis abyssi TaxID=1433403 RepID=A0ABV9NA86_9PROT